MKYQYYRFKITDDSLNFLASIGFEVISTTPLLIGKKFEVSQEAQKTEMFLSMAQYVDSFVNRKDKDGSKRWSAKDAQDNLHVLTSVGGFEFAVVGGGGNEYMVNKNCKSMVTWRLELDAQSFVNAKEGEEGNFNLIYATMGDYRLNFPAFVKKESVDELAPKELIDKLLASGYVDVMEAESDKLNEETEDWVKSEATNAEEHMA